jgi:arylsulfatase A-like enzyme
LPAILGDENQRIRRPALIADTGGHVSELGNYSIRRGKWKLIEINSQRSRNQKTPRFELYDMEKDPYETINLAADHQEVVEKMGRFLQACKQKGLRFMSGVYRSKRR